MPEVGRSEIGEIIDDVGERVPGEANTTERWERDGGLET